MTVYTVHYTLHQPEQEYEELYEVIESLGDACHLMEAVWLLDTDISPATDVRDELSEYISSNDNLFVVEKGSSWGTTFGTSRLV